MGLKTTRAWIDVNEFQYADKILSNLQEIIQRLQRSLIEMKNSTEAPEDVEKQMNETTKDFFYILCLKAEVKCAQGQNIDAMGAVKKAAEIISSFPNEATNLSMLCYNFGVDCYQSKDYTTGVSWLRESCSINKDIVDPNPKTEARTLRLLANCYLEARCENWKENALNAVSLANQKEKYEKAAVWYNYSLSLYPSMSVSEPNLGKLQRNLANCYFNLAEYTKASAAIEVAERCDKKDAHTQYIIFKISLEQGNVEKAMTSLRLLVEYVETGLDSAGIDIICLVAQTAIERNCTELASVALECLISHSNNDRQVLRALQALLRLLLHQMEGGNHNSNDDKKRLLIYIRTAFNKILSAKDQGKMATAEVEEEATWFMKIGNRFKH
ncbi:testis-expressed sequence 11 protein [Elysia marginata]|uniref:Protein ZIP4 homolog n=1 Tax=Elysia marginata TaxID=1093978 RepID=A0AAV4G5D9_9GAST|nr:testis-expressed sequence 11 protein [Elysia marginata]